MTPGEVGEYVDTAVDYLLMNHQEDGLSEYAYGFLHGVVERGWIEGMPCEPETVTEIADEILSGFGAWCE